MSRPWRPRQHSLALASARACPRAASLARSHPGRFPIDHYQLAFSVRPVPARRVAMGLLSYIQSITFWGVIRMVAKLGASSSAGPFSPRASSFGEKGKMGASQADPRCSRLWSLASLRWVYALRNLVHAGEGYLPVSPAGG